MTNVDKQVAEKVSEAVEAAIDRGTPIGAFLRECREAWVVYLSDQRASDQKEWDRLLAPRIRNTP